MYKRFFKRFFDLIFAVVALPVTLVFLVFTAPFIFFEDRGTVFYRARRRGRDGRDFDMLKLRTMKMNSPEIRNPDGSVYTGRNDPRVTRVGRVLRKLSVDELPQILNVLRGDMSLIGPRPTISTVPYDTLDERRKKRLTVRPGITGYSQAFYRNSIGNEEKLEKDCYYVDNLSLALDIKILFRTVGAVLGRKSIYGSEAEERGNSRENEEK